MGGEHDRVWGGAAGAEAGWVGVRLILRGLLTMIRRVLTEMLARRVNLSKGMSRKRMSPETRRRHSTGYMGRNPYSSVRNPREYSRWYHEHHPGYFAKKTKEWLERLPKSHRSVFFAERNKRTRTYNNAYRKLYRRLWGPAKSAPSFTADENVEISNSPYLSELLRKVKAQYPHRTRD